MTLNSDSVPSNPRPTILNPNRKRSPPHPLNRYEKAVVEEDLLTKNELLVKNVGRQDAKKHLSENVTKLMSDNIVQTLGAMLDTICF